MYVCMCEYIYVCMYICMYVCVCVCVSVNQSVSQSVSQHLYLHLGTGECIELLLKVFFLLLGGKRDLNSRSVMSRQI